MQQGDSLKANTLAAGIRTGNYQDALVGCKHYVERNNSSVQVGFEQRMASLNPVDVWLVGNLRLVCTELNRELRLGMNKINFSQEVVGVEHRTDKRTDNLGYLDEYADNFTTLVTL